MRPLSRVASVAGPLQPTGESQFGQSPTGNRAGVNGQTRLHLIPRHPPGGQRKVTLRLGALSDQSAPLRDVRTRPTRKRIWAGVELDSYGTV